MKGRNSRKQTVMTLSRKFSPLLLYHGISLIAIAIVTQSKEFRSGPCTPNLDVFLPFLIFIADIALFAISTIKSIRNRKFQTNLIINIIAFVIFFTICFLPR